VPPTKAAGIASLLRWNAGNQANPHNKRQMVKPDNRMTNARQQPMQGCLRSHAAKRMVRECRASRHQDHGCSRKKNACHWEPPSKPFYDQIGRFPGKMSRTA
jgi:hypothetical protein